MHATATKRERLAVLLSGLFAVTLAYLPVFLLAGLGTFIRQDLNLSIVSIGIGTTGFFTASALSAASVGALCERFGALSVLKVGSGLSALSLLMMSLGSLSIPILAAGLVVGGVGNGLSQTAANVVLYRAFPHSAQGRVFALKQSAAPLVTLVSGLSIAYIVLLVPWEGIIVLITLCVFLPTLICWRNLPTIDLRPQRRQKLRRRVLSDRRLVLFILASFLAFAASTAAVSYLVETLTSIGVNLAISGRVLMLGSATGIGARMTFGFLLDRFDLPAKLVTSALIMIGSGGFFAIVYTRGVPFLAFATVVIFAAGWGWPGIFVLSVVRTFPEKAEWASGAVQSASASGAALGPLTFGAVSVGVGFNSAWVIAGVAMIVAAIALHVVPASPTSGVEAAQP